MQVTHSTTIRAEKERKETKLMVHGTDDKEEKATTEGTTREPKEGVNGRPKQNRD